MTISAIGSPDGLSAFPMLGPSGDNERAERVPDNEAREIARAKAPLPSDSGTIVDVQA
jgi:hypothetical protein